jgi:putative transposase
MRVAQARVLVAEGDALAAVARVMGISRQALDRTPRPRRSPQRRPVTDPVELAIVETAKSNPTDGYRMICCFVRRSLGVAVNRKRVLRVMREQKLIQRRPVEARRRRPGVFKVERPGQLWHLDMTAIWVAEHGWVYLNGISASRTAAAATATPRARRSSRAGFACGVPKLGCAPEKSTICRQDASFGTPQAAVNPDPGRALDACRAQGSSVPPSGRYGRGHLARRAQVQLGHRRLRLALDLLGGGDRGGG